jgi:uncharacterized protein
MVSSLDGEDIFDYSLKVARQWGVGEKDKDNGVLMVVSKNDHRIWIQVGSGLEGDLTDAESGRIIQNVITPEFKKGDFYAGISGGITSIQNQVEGRTDPAQDSRPASSSSTSLSHLLIYVIVFGSFALSWIGAMLSRSKSWWAGGLIGAGVGLSVGSIAGWTLIAVAIAAGLTVFGLLFDWFVSHNYSHRKSLGKTPAWWAGGGGFGGGGSGGGGGFGGGGFSGGGAGGSW